MSSIEIATIFISVISLTISLWATARTNHIANNDLRLSGRTELHSLLHNLDQLMIEKPELSTLYKSYSKYTSNMASPSIPIQNSYILMHFNLFELAFSLFKETRKLSIEEVEIACAWEATMTEFFRDCIRSKDVWIELKHTYYSSYQLYIDTILDELNRNEKRNDK